MSSDNLQHAAIRLARVSPYSFLQWEYVLKTMVEAGFTVDQAYDLITELKIWNIYDLVLFSEVIKGTLGQQKGRSNEAETGNKQM